MRAVLQRVSRAAVRIDGAVSGAIAAGWVALIGVERGDGDRDVETIAHKILHLRAWPDADGKMNLALGEAAPNAPASALPRAILAISQFTLLGDTRRGLRPSFDRAAPSEQARPLYEALLARLRASGVTVECGVFQAHMEVELVNDGPVTLLLESRDRDRERGSRDTDVAVKSL